MELDDLKSTWQNQGSAATESNLTTLIIDQMTQKKYYSKIKKITIPEIIGSSICVIAAGFIALNFNKLDTHIFQAVGAASIIILLTLSVLSVLSLQRLNMKKDFNKPYAETLKIFATQKLAFYKLQKINIILCYLLLVTIIVLLPKLFGDKDITEYKYFWLFAFGTGYIFLLFVSKFATNYYRRTLQQTEELIKLCIGDANN